MIWLIMTLNRVWTCGLLTKGAVAFKIADIVMKKMKKHGILR